MNQHGSWERLLTLERIILKSENTFIAVGHTLLTGHPVSQTAHTYKNTHSHNQIFREAHQILQNITCLVKHSTRCSVHSVKRWPWMLKRPLGGGFSPSALHTSVPWEWVIWWQERRRERLAATDWQRKVKTERGGGGGWYHLTLSREILSQISLGRWLSTRAKYWDEHVGSRGGFRGLTNEQTCCPLALLPSSVPSSSAANWTCSIYIRLSPRNLARVFMVSLSFHKTCYWITVAPGTLFLSLMFCPFFSLLPAALFIYLSLRTTLPHFLSFPLLL